jgi:hypothetical protein
VPESNVRLGGVVELARPSQRWLRISRPEPRPYLVSRDATDYSFICDYCVYEKNSPFHPERLPYWRGDDHSNAEASGPMPLELDEQSVKCQHGHEHLVLREGSERAANFGFG